MFSKALAEAQNYTLPIIFSRRHFNGEITSGCGTCMVLNRDGWILTAAHLAVEVGRATQDKPHVEALERQQKEIEENARLHPNDKHKRLRALRANPSWITHQATLWGVHGGEVTTVRHNLFSDIAIAQVKPFDPSLIKSYPVFKNPSEPMPSGTSLCRLGFPFHDIKATFNEKTGQFDLAPDVLPVPFFPNDGIHTRIALLRSPDGKHSVRFIETSSPGLRGQSGGPIFDRVGHVWAMQSKTQHLSLGFAPEVIEGNRKTVEHQFMHVGWGSHVEEIIAMCKESGVTIQLSS